MQTPEVCAWLTMAGPLGGHKLMNVFLWAKELNNMVLWRDSDVLIGIVFVEAAGLQHFLVLHFHLLRLNPAVSL